MCGHDWGQPRPPPTPIHSPTSESILGSHKPGLLHSPAGKASLGGGNRRTEVPTPCHRENQMATGGVSTANQVPRGPPIPKGGPGFPETSQGSPPTPLQKTFRQVTAPSRLSLPAQKQQVTSASQKHTPPARCLRKHQSCLLKSQGPHPLPCPHLKDE